MRIAVTIDRIGAFLHAGEEPRVRRRQRERRYTSHVRKLTSTFLMIVIPP
ncbi:hypothetical protein [Bradyrhizobium sp. RDI18]